MVGYVGRLCVGLWLLGVVLSVGLAGCSASAVTQCRTHEVKSNGKCVPGAVEGNEEEQTQLAGGRKDTGTTQKKSGPQSVDINDKGDAPNVRVLRFDASTATFSILLSELALTQAEKNKLSTTRHEVTWEFFANTWQEDGNGNLKVHRALGTMGNLTARAARNISVMPDRESRGMELPKQGYIPSTPFTDCIGYEEHGAYRDLTLASRISLDGPFIKIQFVSEDSASPDPVDTMKRYLGLKGYDIDHIVYTTLNQARPHDWRFPLISPPRDAPWMNAVKTLWDSERESQYPDSNTPDDTKNKALCFKKLMAKQLTEVDPPSGGGGLTCCLSV